MEPFVLSSRSSPRMLFSSHALAESSHHMLLRKCQRIHLVWSHRRQVGRSSTIEIRSRPYACREVVVARKLSHGVLIRSVYELEPDDSESCKDEAILYRRTVYDHKAWTHHRSSLRHARTILSMAGSKVISGLGPPVFGLTIIAVLLASYNQAKLTHWMPSWFPLLHVSPLPFQLLAPALALLLVFRTNASYSRFDEARRAWGSNVNRTRDIACQALSWIRHPADTEKLKILLRHCVAFTYCMKSHMLNDDLIREELTPVLEEDELEALLGASHQPIFCLMVISDVIHSCNLSDMERALMNENVTKFFDNLGACERIFKTPIPLSYTRLTSRFLVIWHIALPLAMWDQCHWIVVPATCLSAAVLFCIEEVGVLIEEPSEIFPLELICALARKNVEDLGQIHREYVLRCHQRHWEGDHGKKRN